MSTSALVRPRPVHSPSDLLRAYLPGSFFYSSASGSLLADGVHSVVDAGGGCRARVAAVRRALADAVAAGLPDPMVVGALGFGPGAPASLVVPSVVRRAGSAGGLEPGAEPGWSPGCWRVRHLTAPDEYLAAVRGALDLIGAGSLRKVVLARCVELVAESGVSVPAVLARLVRTDPGAHVFAVDVSEPGDHATRTLLGASPELLVSRRGDQVVANPLAGSEARAADPVEDRRRADRLAASGKDRREHEFVAAQVAEVLGRYCVGLRVPQEPSVIGTGSMWHLSSRISGRLADPEVSALELAEALHPTPAVCGVPLAEARAAIGDLETVERGYYTGMVGWSAPGGDGEWAVTIRSAEVRDRALRLFAGAGVVDGSNPVTELAETSAKLRTLLGALGVTDPL
ncbi:isochorismate synthase DhbC [Pseudonocardia eucalypti]|uniref:isochorismate synthase n=1 Tax=Pseudonocardia eucalypti TaxID=648755 RepID=A0ABP9RBJ9_9PSEU|nr:isochorismate synthase [Pseudonocardia eucalypti]